jgi:hypothetical protein
VQPAKFRDSQQRRLKLWYVQPVLQSSSAILSNYYYSVVQLEGRGRIQSKKPSLSDKLERVTKKEEEETAEVGGFSVYGECVGFRLE